MPYVGPYQQFVIDPQVKVARVQDWDSQAAAITAGLGQVRGEAVTAAASDATAKSAVVTKYAEQRAAAALASAKQFTTDTMNTSGLDLDVDGTPYFRPGSMTLSIHADTDGNPFFLDN